MGLIAFFFLTFTLTWAAWVSSPSPGGVVFLAGVFAPAVVALALTLNAEGWAGVTHLLARIGRWQVDLRWYVFAVFYLVSIKLAAAMIHRMATGAWPVFGDTPWPLMLGAVLVSTWVQAGEEVGWRGYALPRLATRIGLGWGSVLLGVIWAVWHLPLFLLPGTGSTGQSFPIYLLHVTAVSVTMAWLYWKTDGSLLLVMVMHASVNNTTDVVPAAVAGATNPFALSGSLMAWLTVALSWIVAAVLLFDMRHAALSRPRLASVVQS